MSLNLKIVGGDYTIRAVDMGALLSVSTNERVILTVPSSLADLPVGSYFDVALDGIGYVEFQGEFDGVVRPIGAKLFRQYNAARVIKRHGNLWALSGAGFSTQAVQRTLVHMAGDPATTDEYTFTNVAFGTPTNTRTLLLVMGHSGGGPDPATVEIGGVSADIIPNGANSAFAIVQGVSDAIGDIHITYPGNKNRIGIALYALENIRDVTPVAVEGGSNEQIAVLEGGLVVGSCFSNTSDPTSERNLSVGSQVMGADIPDYPVDRTLISGGVIWDGVVSDGVVNVGGPSTVSTAFTGWISLR